MAKFYTISPIGKESPDLFQTCFATFEQQWHSFVTNPFDADIFLFDCFSDLGNYNEREINIVKESPWRTVVCFQEKDFGGMSREKWEGVDLFPNNKIIYFMRKMLKNVEYPSWVFPYEKILMLDFPLTTSQELNSRPIEIFFCGNVSPQRESVCNELSKHFKCDFSLGQQRVPHETWLNRARQSKLFLTADGGGVSDERPYQLITISPMLRQKNEHKQPHPFSDCINCLEVSEVPTKEEIAGIKAVLNDPDYLYEIYTEGISHMKEHYSAQTRANYILETMKKEGII